MKKLLLLSTIALIIISNKTYAQTDADIWFAGRTYLNGLKIVPAPSTNTAEFAKQYKLNKAVWDKVFTYLKQTNLDTLKVGKYIIDGDNAFATVTDNPTKAYAQTSWESHRKYIDFQYVITGAEGMEVAGVATAKVTEPYNAARDVAHYEVAGKLYTATQGTFYLFFPVDAHRVNIKADGSDHDKKIVVKIKYIN
jgi:YhcH/YjgK/YiaL family protein